MSQVATWVSFYHGSVVAGFLVGAFGRILRFLFRKNHAGGLSDILQWVYAACVMPNKFKGPFSAHAMGGRAAAAKLTAAERSAKAKKAVDAREALKRLRNAA